MSKIFDQNNFVIYDPNSEYINGVLAPKPVKNEDLVMFCNLKSISKNRSDILQGDNGKETLRNVASSKFNILKPTDNDYLTTDWTDLKLSNGQLNGDEALGITSVDVTYDSSFVPRITIQMTDVRGQALNENSEGSPYKTFFSFPYPLFVLELKGFYGKMIKYILHLKKYNSRYNYDTGNFEITCEFVGFTFAILSDLNLYFALAAPQMGLSDGNGGVINGRTLILNKYKEQIVKEKNADKRLEIEQIMNSCPTLFDLINGAKNMEGWYRKIAETNSNTLNDKNDLDDYLKNLTIISESLPKDVTNIPTNFDMNKVNKDITSLNGCGAVVIYPLLKLSNTNTIEKISDLQKSIRNVGSIAEKYYGEINTKIEKSLESGVVEMLGFKPTIENVFRIVCNSFEVFLDLLGNTTKNASKARKAKYDEIIVKTKDYSPRNDNSRELEKSFPWPYIWNNDGEIQYLDEYGSSKDFPEIEFVNEYIRAQTLAGELLNLETSGTTGTNNYRDIDFNPIHPIQYESVKPFTTNVIEDLLYEILEHALVSTTYQEGENSNQIQVLGKLDAKNLIHNLGKVNSDYNDLRLNTKDFNGVLKYFMDKTGLGEKDIINKVKTKFNLITKITANRKPRVINVDSQYIHFTPETSFVRDTNILTTDGYSTTLINGLHLNDTTDGGIYQGYPYLKIEDEKIEIIFNNDFKYPKNIKQGFGLEWIKPFVKPESLLVQNDIKNNIWMYSQENTANVFSILKLDESFQEFIKLFTYIDEDKTIIIDQTGKNREILNNEYNEGIIKISGNNGVFNVPLFYAIYRYRKNSNNEFTWVYDKNKKKFYDDNFLGDYNSFLNTYWKDFIHSNIILFNMYFSEQVIEKRKKDYTDESINLNEFLLYVDPNSGEKNGSEVKYYKPDSGDKGRVYNAGKALFDNIYGWLTSRVVIINDSVGLKDIYNNPYDAFYPPKTSKVKTLGVGGKIINRYLSPYFIGFNKELINLDTTGSKVQAEASKEALITNKDIKLSLYLLFKNINDKWIYNNGDTYAFNLTGDNTDSRKSLIDYFYFVDRGNRYIGDKIMVDISVFYDYHQKNNLNNSFYSLISQLLSKNDMNFHALTSYISYYDTNPETYFESTLNTTDIGSQPAFICQYIGKPTTYQYENDNHYPDYLKFDFDQGKFYDEAGGAIFNQKDPTKKISDEFLNKAVCFVVDAGIQNQNMFKSIQLDQSEFRESQESLAVIDKLTNKSANRTVDTIGNNLYNTYSRRSYTCKVESMGNLMIQPTMYFYLRYVPLFNGLYLITKVNHNVQPGNITTNFEGVRVPVYTFPYTNSFIVNLSKQVYNTFKTSVLPNVTPNVNFYQNSSKEIKDRIQLIDSNLKKYGITKKETRAAILAVVYKETEDFSPKIEIGPSSTIANAKTRFGGRDIFKTIMSNNDTINYAIQDAPGNPKGVRLLNFCYGIVGGQPGSKRITDFSGHKFDDDPNSDGWKYRGRGYNQLTFKYNYKYFNKGLDEDIVINPDAMTKPNIAAAVLAKYNIDNFKYLKDKQELDSDGKPITDINSYTDYNLAYRAMFNITAGIKLTFQEAYDKYQKGTSYDRGAKVLKSIYDALT